MFTRKITRNGAIIAAVIAFLISGVLTGTAPAAEPAHYRDYLSSQHTGVEVGASGMEQCALPLAERRGRWLCPDEKTLTSPIKATAPAEGYCEAWACRNRYDDFFADMSVHGIWGWNGTMLGQMDGYADIQLTGAQSWSKPVRYVNTRDTHDVIFTGDLLNAAPGVEGDQIEGKFSLYLAGNAGPGESKTWGPNGYKAYDNTMWDHTLVHQFSFKHAEYPGYWYLYVKSTCMHTNDKQIYRYYGVRQVPANSDGGGWRR